MTLPTPAEVEELSINGWPALQQILLDGWVLRFSGGYTRRANSINPLASGVRPLPDKVALCEQLYAERGRPAIFRIPGIAPDRALDRLLDERGYAARDETCVLLAPRLQTSGASDPGVRIEPTGAPDWWEAHTRFSALSPDQSRLARAITDLIPYPVRFAAMMEDDQIRAIALLVLQGEHLCIHAVATDPAYRRAGFGRRTLTALLEWAATRGARHGYIQVVADNSAARALYAGLGFREELYRYHYRMPPGQPAA